MDRRLGGAGRGIHREAQHIADRDLDRALGGRQAFVEPGRRREGIGHRRGADHLVVLQQLQDHILAVAARLTDVRLDVRSGHLVQRDLHGTGLRRGPGHRRRRGITRIVGDQAVNGAAVGRKVLVLIVHTDAVVLVVVRLRVHIGTEIGNRLPFAGHLTLRRPDRALRVGLEVVDPVPGVLLHDRVVGGEGGAVGVEAQHVAGLYCRGVLQLGAVTVHGLEGRIRLGGHQGQQIGDGGRGLRGERHIDDVRAVRGAGLQLGGAERRRSGHGERGRRLDGLAGVGDGDRHRHGDGAGPGAGQRDLAGGGVHGRAGRGARAERERGAGGDGRRGAVRLERELGRALERDARAAGHGRVKHVVLLRVGLLDVEGDGRLVGGVIRVGDDHGRGLGGAVRICAGRVGDRAGRGVHGHAVDRGLQRVGLDAGRGGGGAVLRELHRSGGLGADLGAHRVVGGSILRRLGLDGCHILIGDDRRDVQVRSGRAAGRGRRDANHVAGVHLHRALIRFQAIDEVVVLGLRGGDVCGAQRLAVLGQCERHRARSVGVAPLRLVVAAECDLHGAGLRGLPRDGGAAGRIRVVDQQALTPGAVSSHRRQVRQVAGESRAVVIVVLRHRVLGGERRDVRPVTVGAVLLLGVPDHARGGLELVDPVPDVLLHDGVFDRRVRSAFDLEAQHVAGLDRRVGRQLVAAAVHVGD